MWRYMTDDAEDGDRYSVVNCEGNLVISNIHDEYIARQIATKVNWYLQTYGMGAAEAAKFHAKGVEAKWRITSHDKVNYHTLSFECRYVGDLVLKNPKAKCIDLVSQNNGKFVTNTLNAFRIELDTQKEIEDAV